MHRYATSDAGSSDILQCDCMQGYVNVQMDPREPAQCQLCSSGTECDVRGVTVPTLPLRIGYYRLSPVSLDVQRCPDANENCPLTDDGLYAPHTAPRPEPNPHPDPQPRP